MYTEDQNKISSNAMDRDIFERLKKGEKIARKNEQRGRPKRNQGFAEPNYRE